MSEPTSAARETLPIPDQGGAYAGWSVYLKDGSPKYCHNLLGLRQFHVGGDTAIPEGTHQLRMESYDGGGLGKGGTVSLYVDGEKTGEGRVEATVPMVSSADETCDLGSDTALGGQRRLRLGREPLHGHDQLGAARCAEAAEDLDHLITPGERLRMAMARQ